MVRHSLAIVVLSTLWAHSASAQQDWMKSWAFGGRTESQVASQLQFDCRQRIKMVDRLCTLDDVQELKLAKAAEADISRLFRDIAKIRRKVEAMDVGQNNQRVNELWQVISPIQIKLQQGVFADASLFQKVMRSTLDDEQQSLYEAELEKNRRRRWKVITRSNVADMERSMPLLAEQREQLLALLDEQELPMKLQKQMDGYAGFLKLLKFKQREKRLAEFLDEDQINVIDQYCERYKGWERIVQ